MPRSWDVAVTLAPATAAPLGSVTVPVIEAVTSWAQAHCKVPITATNERNKQKSVADGRLIKASSNLSTNSGVMLYSGSQFIVKKKMQSGQIFLMQTH